VNDCFTLGNTCYTLRARSHLADLNSADSGIYTRKLRRDYNVSTRDRVFLTKLTDAPFTVSQLHPYYNYPLSFELFLRNGGSFYQIPSPNTTPALAKSQLPKLGYCIQAPPIKLSAPASNIALTPSAGTRSGGSGGTRIFQKGEKRCSKEGVTTVRNQIFMNRKGFTVDYNV